MGRSQLEQRYASLSDEELVSLAAEDLTDLAKECLKNELAERGITDLSKYQHTQDSNPQMSKTIRVLLIVFGVLLITVGVILTMGGFLTIIEENLNPSIEYGYLVILSFVYGGACIVFFRYLVKNQNVFLLVIGFGLTAFIPGLLLFFGWVLIRGYSSKRDAINETTTTG